LKQPNNDITETVSHLINFLTKLHFSFDRIMDTDSKAVMMAWEKPLMEAHARAVCTKGGRVLNVGFGMGLVDEAIERYEPEEHAIIEAHPDVYARMLKSGWGERKNVKIIFGRWQDVLPQLGTYDGTINYLFSLLVCN
jgi:type IV protein arginine methyltransferase